jgi:repressor LexA
MPTYTAKQREVLKIIRRSVEERGIAPTLGEIGAELGGITRVAVLDHLRALERKGAIRRRPRERRAIEILDPDFLPSQGWPLAGRIAAGSPILEVEDREGISLEGYLGADDGCFLLRVEGDSMIEDHVMDGDLVLVERRETARDGEMVVAVVDEEVTLKRLYREGAQIRLQPANGSLDPRRVPAEGVAIRGVVRGVIRRT